MVIHHAAGFDLLHGGERHDLAVTDALQGRHVAGNLFGKALEDVAVSLVMRRCPRYLWEMLAWWPVAHDPVGAKGLMSRRQ